MTFFELKHVHPGYESLLDEIERDTSISEEFEQEKKDPESMWDSLVTLYW